MFHVVCHRVIAKEVYLKPETLADFVSRMLAERDLSTRDVEANSGSEISHGYVAKIARGEVKDPSTRKLEALAKGLRVPYETLDRIARGLPPRLTEEELDELAEQELEHTLFQDVDRSTMDPQDKAELKRMIKMGILVIRERLEKGEI